MSRNAVADWNSSKGTERGEYAPWEAITPKGHSTTF